MQNDENRVVHGGGRHIVPQLKQPHPRYGEARAKAHQLETTIENAQKEYTTQLSKIIRKLQCKFYRKYGKQIQELEDLEDAISNIQSGGLKNLKRQLTQLYLMADSEEMEQHGGGGGGAQEQLERTAKQLYTEYKQKYFPNDDYQRKRDAEAQKLQMAIMGSIGGQRGGGGAMRAYVVPSNGRVMPMLGGHSYDDGDDRVSPIDTRVLQIGDDGRGD